jgi:hypothetical protein
MDARHQLVLVEWLGHVVVGAETEAPHLVLDSGKAGQDQDRRVDLRHPEGLQHLIAGHVRQVEVKQYDVIVIQLAEIDPFLSEVGGVDVEPLGFQHQLDALRRR